MSDNQNFGDRLEIARVKVGVSVKGLAEGMGVAPSTIYSWQQNKSRPNLEEAIPYPAG